MQSNLEIIDTKKLSFQFRIFNINFCIPLSCRARQPLSSGLKLAITLRFLATGNSYHSWAFSFHVAHNISFHPGGLSSRCRRVPPGCLQHPFYPGQVATGCLGVSRPMELSSCMLGHRWQACRHKEAKEKWVFVLLL